MNCAHDTVTLPDTLPPAVEAALRLTVDRAGQPNEGQIAARITRALWAESEINPSPRAAYNAAHACVAMRRHPALIRYATPMGNSSTLCRVADRFWTETPERTELGLADRITAVYGADLAWSTTGEGYAWDQTRWHHDATGARGIALAKAVVRELVQIEATHARQRAYALAPDGTAATGDADAETAVVDAKAATFSAGCCQAAKIIKAGLELVRSEPGILVPADKWDAHPALLTVANGTIELTGGGARLREHRREDHLTRVARGAYRRDADRLEWDRFVTDVLPDPAVRERVQRLAGYSLFGGNTERLLVILLGPTTTGKSTFVETIAHVLGEYGGPFELNMFRGTRDGGAHRADLVAALPRRFIQTTEASDRWQIHADAIKRITGGDTLASRGAYARIAVESQPQFVPWLATNTAPQVIGADDALWRRLEVLPFTAQIAREDPNLALRLRTEGSDGVLGWLLEGWEQYARHGLGATPTACQVAAAQLQRDLSLVDTWLAECTKPDPDGAEPVQAFGDSWQAWCAEQHVPMAERTSNVTLARELTARGYPSVHIGPRDDRQRVRRGLRLVDRHAPGLRVVQ